MPTSTVTSTKLGPSQSSKPSSRPADGGGLKLVAIGGGSGLAVLLRGLKGHVGSAVDSLTAVVTVSDDGGSSGRLRREFGMLAPGDVRNCLAAVADDEDLLTRLFQYRFTDGEGLSGHSFGNLFLTALTGITGDFYQAVLTAEEVLSVKGRILPATLGDVRLAGTGRSGRLYEGESAIGQSGEPIRELRLVPPRVPAFPPAVAAIREAALILVGPGSLYTSILPNLLIAGIRESVHGVSAPVVLLMNLMTQPGETDAMDGAAHLEAIERHAGSGLVDAALINVSELPTAGLEIYAQTGAVPVITDEATLRRRGVDVVAADLLDDGDLIRHDPTRLARAVLALPGTLAAGGSR